MPLSDTALRNLKPDGTPSKLADSEGLYLYVSPTGGKLWRMDYRFAGKRKTLSFGAYPTVSLKDARTRRDNAKELLAKDIDPGAQKKAAKAEAEAIAKEQALTFAVVAQEWFETKKGVYAASNNKKKQGLIDLLNERIGNKPITTLAPADVLAAIRPVEAAGHSVTAHKMAGTAGHPPRKSPLSPCTITTRMGHFWMRLVCQNTTPIDRCSLLGIIFCFFIYPFPDLQGYIKEIRPVRTIGKIEAIIEIRRVQSLVVLYECFQLIKSLDEFRLICRSCRVFLPQAKYFVPHSLRKRFDKIRQGLLLNKIFFSVRLLAYRGSIPAYGFRQIVDNCKFQALFKVQARQGAHAHHDQQA